MSPDASKSPDARTPELAAAPKRLASLDAYRGAIMLLMASGGLGLAEIAKEFPDSSVWQILGHQSDHVQWAGCTLWDLIQPAFMFMVGIALPWSLASRSARGQSFKLMRLVLAGLLGIALGLLLDLIGICPIVKRIWTPAWTLYSAGYVAIMLAVFVALVDGLAFKRLAFPLIIVGLNPITLYCLFQLSTSFIRHQLQIHLGQDVFAIFGDLWSPMMKRAGVLLVLWLIILWMYRRKVFLRL